MTSPTGFKGEPTVLSMSGNATQVWSGYQLSVPILFFNQDPTNIVYLSYQNNVAIGATNAVALNPQTSVTMDGSRTIYAVGAKGAGPLQIIPGATSYQGVGPTVTPLVGGSAGNGGSVSGAPAIANITPGASSPVLTLADVSQFSSYDINAFAFAQSPGAVNSVIVVQFQFQWFDDLTTGIPVFEEDWTIWAGRASTSQGGVNTLAGCGPMHGRYMSVNISISPGAANNATLQYVNIFGSGRTVPYSDWRQNGQAVNPNSNGVTLQAGGGTSFDNTLAQISNLTLTANQFIFIACGLYSGPAYFRYQTNGGVPLHNVVLTSMAGQVSGGLGAGTATVGVLANIPADTLEHEQTLLLPRAPTAFIIQGAAAGTTSFSFQMIAQQAA